MIKRDIDVVVVGGGAAGLAAAIRAKEGGARTVMILDRNEELGGILPQCIHTGFGLFYPFKENLTGPEYITRFIKRVQDLQIEGKLDTMVLRISPEREIVAINAVDGILKTRAKAVVLAMGCRERTRGALLIPGTRPAGIFTAGTAQRLMDIEGYMPGKKIVVLGSGDVGLIMARRFVMEGAEVGAVVEVMPYPGGLSRNVVQCLQDFDIPLLLGHTITFIHGSERVEGVTVAEVDSDWRPIPGTEKEIDCDAVILSVGLIPENELSETAGVLLDPATGGPVVDERMETSVRGIFACGNVVHVHDLVDHVTLGGELAGGNAAKHALNRLPPLKRRLALRAGDDVRYVVPQVISGEAPVALYLRVRKPMRDVKFRVGNLSTSRRVVRPAETVMIKLTKERLGMLERGDEILIGVEQR